MPETKNNKRHGGAYDRGSADYYYRRPRQPHYFMGGTNTSPRVDEQNMTEDEVVAYHKGYDDAELNGDQKDYR
jgi:hypothetical protein|tara:strand:+ start:123 stop:341 length:219 start_codon:yes stop_codon:yes gene_type:complete